MIRSPEGPVAEYVDSWADSRLWKHFHPRADDIVVVTPPKSGTTWTQAIVALLLSGDPEVDANPSTNSPWIDAAGSRIEEVAERLEAQTHRRHVKTHTPFDGIPFWPDLTYVCVYRHPIDVFFSWRKHQRNMTIEIEDLPIIEDVHADFREFLTSAYQGTAGPTLRGIVHHYKSALQQSDRPNVLRLHYADMTRDLEGSMARVADHLGIGHPPVVMASLVDAAGFDRMKANAQRFALGRGKGVFRQLDAFFDSASSNKWEGRLADEDLDAYEARLSDMLDPDARAWLEWGGAGTGRT